MRTAGAQWQRLGSIDTTGTDCSTRSLPGKCGTARLFLVVVVDEKIKTLTTYSTFTRVRGRDGLGVLGIVSRPRGGSMLMGTQRSLLGHDRIFASCCNSQRRRKFVEAEIERCGRPLRSVVPFYRGSV